MSPEGCLLACRMVTKHRPSSRAEEECSKVRADIERMIVERDEIARRCTQLENDRKAAEVRTP